MRRRRPLGRWEDAYLDGIYGLVLTAALVFLLWSLAGCGTYSKHLQQSATTTTNQRDAWQSNETTAKQEATNASGTSTRKGSRRTIVRRRDGTIAREIFDLGDETTTFLVSSAASAASGKQVAAASESQVKKDENKRVDVKGSTGWPWWVHVALVLVLAGVLYACYRRFRGSLPW